MTAPFLRCGVERTQGIRVMYIRRLTPQPKLNGILNIIYEIEILYQMISYRGVVWAGSVNWW